MKVHYQGRGNGIGVITFYKIAMIICSNLARCRTVRCPISWWYQAERAEGEAVGAAAAAAAGKQEEKVEGGVCACVSVDLKLLTWKDFHMATRSQGPPACLCVRCVCCAVYTVVARATTDQQVSSSVRPSIRNNFSLLSADVSLPRLRFLPQNI